MRLTDWRAKATAAIIIGAIVYFFGTVLWDVYAAESEGRCLTVSEQSMTFFLRHVGAVLAFVFLCGFTAGHVLWFQTVRVLVDGKSATVTSIRRDERGYYDVALMPLMWFLLVAGIAVGALAVWLLPKLWSLFTWAVCS